MKRRMVYGLTLGKKLEIELLCAYGSASFTWRIMYLLKIVIPLLGFWVKAIIEIIIWGTNKGQPKIIWGTNKGRPSSDRLKWQLRVVHRLTEKKTQNRLAMCIRYSNLNVHLGLFYRFAIKWIFEYVFSLICWYSGTCMDI